MKRVSVYSPRDELQGEFLVQVLASHDIPAEVTGAPLAASFGEIPATYGSLQVRVDEADVERAAPVIRQFERSRRLALVEKVGDAGAGATWVCRNCGEVIEPQFTDCWKCQTSREPPGDEGADASAPSPPARLPPDPLLTVDLPCVRCAYNLRALPVDGKCPECGFPALASLLRTMQGQQEWSLVNEPALTPCLDYLEQQLDYPIEAVFFVLKVWPRAAALAGAGVSETSAPNYDDLAAALRDLAVGFIGDPVTAGRVMLRWNLATGRDVERLVGRLTELQLV